MRILFLWSYYEQYTRSFYASRPDLIAASYVEQQTALLDDYFSWPGYLVRALRALGHEADIIIGNAEPLQAAWARQRDIPFRPGSWQTDIPFCQIQSFRPDVYFAGAIPQYWGSFLKTVRDSCGKVFLWFSSPIPRRLELGPVDCILTSIPHFVDVFQNHGYTSEYFQAACIDPAILRALQPGFRNLPVTFVGGLTPSIHGRRVDILSYVCKRIPIQVWGYRFGRMPRHPRRLLKHLRRLPSMVPIQKRHQGVVYGLNYFQVMARSQIALNVHIDVAAGMAGNMRLFEATGCGALLMTERAPNLSLFFEPDGEVVVYDNEIDLVEKIKYYLAHEAEREQIALAGQQRTLNYHNSQIRARELLSVFERFGG